MTEHEQWMAEFQRLERHKCFLCGLKESCGYLCQDCWKLARAIKDCWTCSGTGTHTIAPGEPGPCSACHASGKDLEALREAYRKATT